MNLTAMLMCGISMLAAGHVHAEPGRYAECNGRIVRAIDGKSVTFAQIAPALSRADFILFGERHGVREQAQVSACVLGAIAASGRPTALVMEMLSRSDQKMIDAWRKNHPESPAGLGVELKWWQRGWPAYETWLPLLNRAFGMRVPVFGGDLPEAEGGSRPVAVREETAMVKRLGGTAKEITASWERAMTAAHCGLVSQKDARQLGLQQVRRDLSIADTAIAARGKTGAVLLQIGRGHSRKDRSLYAVLSDKAASVVSIGAFAGEEKTNSRDSQVHDYLWIVGSDPRAGKSCAFMGDANKNTEETSP